MDFESLNSNFKRLKAISDQGRRIRVLVIGDSYMQGQDSVIQGNTGPRLAIWCALEAAGLDVQFVGDLESNNAGFNEVGVRGFHNAIGGATLGEMNAGSGAFASLGNIATQITRHQPDLVVVGAGGNDVPTDLTALTQTACSLIQQSLPYGSAAVVCHGGYERVLAGAYYTDAGWENKRNTQSNAVVNFGNPLIQWVNFGGAYEEAIKDSITAFNPDGVHPSLVVNPLGAASILVGWFGGSEKAWLQTIADCQPFKPIKGAYSAFLSGANQILVASDAGRQFVVRKVIVDASAAAASFTIDAGAAPTLLTRTGIPAGVHTFEMPRTIGRGVPIRASTTNCTVQVIYDAFACWEIADNC